MPFITLPANSGNLSLETLLGANAPQTGFARQVFHEAEGDNTGAIKVCLSGATAIKFSLRAGESYLEDTRVAVKRSYLRNDHTTDAQTVYVGVVPA